MSRPRGFSAVELLIVLFILTTVGAIASTVILRGQQVFSEETVRQVNTTQARMALEIAVRRLRETAARTAAVNFSLDDDEGHPLVRDGLLVWTDTDHQTVYIDRDEEGAPGAGLPDLIGWDDRDGGGQADILALALMPQDRDQDGVQDFIDNDHDGVADDVVEIDGATDGRPDLKWRLVLAELPSRLAADDPANWADAETLIWDVVPFVTTVAGVEVYDTIEAQGIQPESYDYGHDGDFDVEDAAQWDGVVDEVETGLADTEDSVINTQAELDLIGSFRITIATATVYQRHRFDIAEQRLDVERGTTAVAPRSFAIVQRKGLQFPDPT